MENMERSTNNGTSSMLMNGRESQERENSTKTSVSMLRETSTLCHNCQTTDISTSSTTETLLSRLPTQERLKLGTSIRNHWQSRPGTTTNHGTLEAQEELETCKSGAPTQDGGRSSSTQVSISVTFNSQTNALMYLVVKIMKHNQSLSTTDTTVQTKDGRLSIPTKQQFRARDLTRTSVSISTDHSTLSQDYQLTELLNTEVDITCGLSNGSWTKDHNNGYLTRPGLSNQLPIRDIAWAFRAKEEAILSELRVQTQDGGRCSDITMETLSTRKERSLMFTVDLTWKTDKSLCGTSTMVSTNNGTSSMLMNKSQSQRRVKWVQNGASLSRDHSTLYQRWRKTDIWPNSHPQGMLSSRLQTVTNLRSSTSTRNQEALFVYKTLVTHSWPRRTMM